LKRSILALFLSVVLIAGIVYGLSPVSVNTPFHIHVNKGAQPGLAVSLQFLEFGNITAGSPANMTITASNTGNCPESVTLTVSSPNATLPMVYSPFTLSPGGQIQFLASFSANQTRLMLGDYTGNINWSAVCA